MSVLFSSAVKSGPKLHALNIKKNLIAIIIIIVLDAPSCWAYWKQRIFSERCCISELQEGAEM